MKTKRKVWSGQAAYNTQWRRDHPKYQSTWIQRKREEAAGRPRPSECELCGVVALTYFDHNHKTHAFRGWLCNRCNLVLGHVKDSASLLEKMIEYLKKNADNPPLAKLPSGITKISNSGVRYKR